jgi:hypothetical protein
MSSGKHEKINFFSRSFIGRGEEYFLKGFTPSEKLSFLAAENADIITHGMMRDSLP